MELSTRNTTDIALLYGDKRRKSMLVFAPGEFNSNRLEVTSIQKELKLKLTVYFLM